MIRPLVYLLHYGVLVFSFAFVALMSTSVNSVSYSFFHIGYLASFFYSANLISNKDSKYAFGYTSSFIALNIAFMLSDGLLSLLIPLGLVDLGVVDKSIIPMLGVPFIYSLLSIVLALAFLCVKYKKRTFRLSKLNAVHFVLTATLTVVYLYLIGWFYTANSEYFPTVYSFYTTMDYEYFGFGISEAYSLSPAAFYFSTTFLALIVGYRFKSLLGKKLARK